MIIWHSKYFVSKPDASKIDFPKSPPMSSSATEICNVSKKKKAYVF